MKNKLILVWVLSWWIIGVALAADRYPFATTQDATRFLHLTQQFRCLVCQNEDLASSQAPLANDLRQVIYQMIKAGKSDREITQFMIHRYGHFVLLTPPLLWTTVLLWLLPFLLLTVGGLIFYRVLKRYRI